jgi:RNA polymerase sigma-70 factor (ECF subfamily)
LSDNLPYDEKELLTRIADGDEKAFEKLYRSYARELIPFFVRLTSNESAANDLLQNTFLAVWLDRTKLKEINNINAYLYKD